MAPAVAIVASEPVLVVHPVVPRPPEAPEGALRLRRGGFQPRRRVARQVGAALAQHTGSGRGELAGKVLAQVAHRKFPVGAFGHFDAPVACGARARIRRTPSSASARANCVEPSHPARRWAEARKTA